MVVLLFRGFVWEIKRWEMVVVRLVEKVRLITMGRKGQEVPSSVNHRH